MDKPTNQEYSDKIFSKFNKYNNLMLISMNGAFDLDRVFKEYFIKKCDVENTISIKLDSFHGLDATIIDKQTGKKTKVC